MQQSKLNRRAINDCAKFSALERKFIGLNWKDSAGFTWLGIHHLFKWSYIGKHIWGLCVKSFDIAHIFLPVYTLARDERRRGKRQYDDGLQGKRVKRTFSQSDHFVFSTTIGVTMGTALSVDRSLIHKADFVTTLPTYSRWHSRTIHWRTDWCCVLPGSPDLCS